MQFPRFFSSISLFALTLRIFGCWSWPAETFDLDDDYYDEIFPVYDEVKSDGNENNVPILPDLTTTSAPSHSEASDTCNCSCGIGNQKSRIVGGENAQPHEFPWLAAMVREGRLYCAASLITPRHLLTAAHCLRGFEKEEILIVLGGHDRKRFHVKNDDIVVKKIEKISLHPDFDPLTYDSDIAVITIESPVEFSYHIKPICLPYKEGGNYTGSKAVVVGWGRLAESKPTSNMPLKVEVVVMSKNECDNTGYGSKRITDNMFCAGYLEGGKDSCQGDSGGPLHVYNKGLSTEIIGVVSWGRGCARRNFPGVYTKITNYMDFVLENIQPNCLCSHL